MSRALKAKRPEDVIGTAVLVRRMPRRCHLYIPLLLVCAPSAEIWRAHGYCLVL